LLWPRAAAAGLKVCRRELLVHCGVYLSPKLTGEYLLHGFSVGVEFASEACICTLRAGTIEALETSNRRVLFLVSSVEWLLF